MVRGQLPALPAVEISKLPACAAALITGGKPSAVFRVPGIDGQKPFAADRAALRRVADAEALEQIGAQKAHKGNVVHPLDQHRCRIIFFLYGNVLHGGVHHRHPVSSRKTDLRRKGLPKQFCQSVRTAIRVVGIHDQGKLCHCLLVGSKGIGQLCQYRRDPAKQNAVPILLHGVLIQRPHQQTHRISPEALHALFRKRLREIVQVKAQIDPGEGLAGMQQLQRLLRSFFRGRKQSHVRHPHVQPCHEFFELFTGLDEFFYRFVGNIQRRASQSSGRRSRSLIGHSVLPKVQR